MNRRWTAGTTANVSGIWFRVVTGKKENGDLRLEWRVAGEWRAVEMAAAFLMTDFFVENEEHLRQYRPHWRQTGADYFFGFLKEAVANGWSEAQAHLKDQQNRLSDQTVTGAEPAALRVVPDDFDDGWLSDEARAEWRRTS